MKQALCLWVLLNGEKMLVLIYEMWGEKNEDEEDGSRSTAMEAADNESVDMLTHTSQLYQKWLY